jgi:hypothetical protein
VKRGSRVFLTESDLNFGTATQHHTTQQSGLYLNNHVVFQRETTRALPEAPNGYFGTYFGYFDKVFYLENWVRVLLKSRASQARLVSLSG